jgi:hypothetical protein
MINRHYKQGRGHSFTSAMFNRPILRNRSPDFKEKITARQTMTNPAGYSFRFAVYSSHSFCI